MIVSTGSSKGDPKKKSHKQTKGYSRVGGLLKSKSTKEDLEKTQARMNKFSKSDTKRVAETMKINTKTTQALKEGLELNEYGAPKGGQKHRKFKLNRSGKAKDPGQRNR